jgi:hypothetical protein
VLAVDLLHGSSRRARLERDRQKSVERSRRWYLENRALHLARSKEWARNEPLSAKIFRETRGRARREGIAFTIEIGDITIPERCPVLGILLEKRGERRTDASPSIDRIDATRGYVKGNVAIISWRANRIKADATAEDLKLISDWMRAKGAT